MSYWVYAQNESPIFSITDGLIGNNPQYVDTNDMVNAKYTLHVAGQVEVGGVIYTVQTAKFAGWDVEPGFNVIEISRNGRGVFRHTQADGLITFDEGVYGPTLQRFSDNDCFITCRLSDEAVALLFAGWSYGNTPSQLFIVVLTPDDVQVVYNKPANIIDMTNNVSNFSVSIQTSIPDPDQRIPTYTIYKQEGVLWIKPYRPRIKLW